MLYDKGFSNIWTKLSLTDYHKQVLIMSISDINSVISNMNLGANKFGLYVEGTSRNIWLAPSQRKYKGRKTPIKSKYQSLDDLGKLVLIFKTYQNCDVFLRLLYVSD